MATIVFSNRFKVELAQGNIDLDGDSIRGILMNNAFTFNPDSHETLSDVSANELANGNGYTTNGQVLAGAIVAEDEANDEADITFSDLTWTASGGSIGPSNGILIYDDTHASDVVIGYAAFTSAITAADGVDFVVSSIQMQIA